jgi:hypothetical protein
MIKSLVVTCVTWSWAQESWPVDIFLANIFWKFSGSLGWNSIAVASGF